MKISSLSLASGCLLARPVRHIPRVEGGYVTRLDPERLSKYLEVIRVSAPCKSTERRMSHEQYGNRCGKEDLQSTNQDEYGGILDELSFSNDTAEIRSLRRQK